MIQRIQRFDHESDHHWHQHSPVSMRLLVLREDLLTSQLCGEFLMPSSGEVEEREGGAGGGRPLLATPT